MLLVRMIGWSVLVALVVSVVVLALAHRRQARHIERLERRMQALGVVDSIIKQAGGTAVESPRLRRVK